MDERAYDALRLREAGAASAPSRGRTVSGTACDLARSACGPPAGCTPLHGDAASIFVVHVTGDKVRDEAGGNRLTNLTIALDVSTSG